MRVGQGSLSGQLTRWAQANSAGKAVADLTVGQMKQASADLKVSLGEVMAAAETALAQSAAATERAGLAHETLGLGQSQASLGHGGVQFGDTAMMVRFTFDGRTDAPAGVASDLDMDSAWGPALMALAQDIARGPSVPQSAREALGAAAEKLSDAALFAQSGYTAADAATWQKAQRLPSAAAAEAEIARLVRSGQEHMLERAGVTYQPLNAVRLEQAVHNAAIDPAVLQGARDTLPFVTAQSQAAFVGLAALADDLELLVDLGMVAPDELELDDEDLGRALQFPARVLTGALGEQATPAAAFARSGFTASDVATAQQALGLPTADAARAWIGQAVLEGNDAGLHKAGLQSQAFNAGRLEQAFADAGFGQAAIDQAITAFPFVNSEDDARQFIGLCEVTGRFALLDLAGIADPA